LAKRIGVDAQTIKGLENGVCPVRTLIAAMPAL
jgi:DNA-binding XRE family transcriptional regulator